MCNGMHIRLTETSLSLYFCVGSIDSVTVVCVCWGYLWEQKHMQAMLIPFRVQLMCVCVAQFLWGSVCITLLLDCQLSH